MILKQYYAKPTPYIDKKEFSKPCGIFKFNEKGIIIESFEYSNDDTGKGDKLTAKYEYDSLNLLKYKTVDYETSDYNKPQDFTEYFYTNQVIDSSITKQTFVYRNKTKDNNFIKTIYNKNGLKYKTIHNDSLIIYHKHLK